MLSPRAEAPTANPDGRSAPEVSLDTRTWRCRADTTGHWGRFRREMGLLMLHGDGRQGYSIPGNAPASCVSGECRINCYPGPVAGAAGPGCFERCVEPARSRRHPTRVAAYLGREAGSNG